MHYDTYKRTSNHISVTGTGLWREGLQGIIARMIPKGSLGGHVIYFQPEVYKGLIKQLF